MHEAPFVSVVVPVWRDWTALRDAVDSIGSHEAVEIVVSTAFEERHTHPPVLDGDPRVRWISSSRGRASQMNAGAAVAGGRWLLFLHADSRLPSDWLRVLSDLDGDASVVGGAFRLQLDSADWRARIVELGVRLRVALLRLPYGDQALFARRTVFEALGGYRDLPLMDDVDFVRRLKRTGRVHQASACVVTSARRWKSDGWLHRSRQNAVLVARFLLGDSPARLARAYFRRHRSAVVIMARAPWTGGKTRLATGVHPAAHAALREAMFFDTLDAVRAVTGAERIVACDPPDACRQLREAVEGVDVLAQHGADLGERINTAFSDVFRLGCESVVVIGSDLPDLPAAVLTSALTALSEGDDCVVLGPAPDGGYYLIGLNRPHPELFRAIDWGTDRVLAQTLDATRRHGLRVVLLESWRDIDEDRDLEDLLRRSTDGAVRTRHWTREHFTSLRSPL